MIFLTHFCLIVGKRRGS